MTLNNIELEELKKTKHELAIINQISRVFLTVPDDQMYVDVLQIVLKAMDSKYGLFGYIDPEGSLVFPSLTREVWSQCQIPDKNIVFPREKWGGIWGRSLIEKKTLFSNKPFEVPKGHVPITRALAVSIIFKETVIGLLLVGNKTSDYNEDDCELLESIAGRIAPILDARLKRDREEAARKKAEESLRQKARELHERVKELNCFFDIAKIVETHHSLDDILHGIVDIIPSACQYPETTSAGMVLGEKNYVTKNFKTGACKHTSVIKINGGNVGVLEVYCGETKSETGECRCLPEEISLIDAIAERIGRIIQLKNLENERNELYTNLQNALTRILGGFLPICASCKNIRDEKGVWHQVENYVQDHSEAEFSHSICPECKEKLYPYI